LADRAHSTDTFGFRKHNTPLTLIINLDVNDSVILSRISDRWVHLPSGRIYNTSYNPPKVPGLDDYTGEPLTKRPDDNPEIFAKRLKAFYETTNPLLEYYKKLGKAHTVRLTGETSDEIWPKLEATVKESFPSLRERRHSLSEALLKGKKAGGVTVEVDNSN
jgi:adenylate kinase